MAAEGLRRAAEQLGHAMKVETQGSVGAKNVLTAEDVAAADAVVIAADTKVDLSRFVGKRIYETGTKEALKHGDEVIDEGARLERHPLAGRGRSRQAAAAASTAVADLSRRRRGGWRGVVKGVYQNLMTGVSYMLPFVVAGGLLIAISFAFDIDAPGPPRLLRRPPVRHRQRRASPCSSRCSPGSSPTPSPTGPGWRPASSAATSPPCRSTPGSSARCSPGSSPAT